MANNNKKSCRTLTAEIDADANHVLVEHKRSGASSTYHCAMDTGELDGLRAVHELTPDEIAWLKSIEKWVTDSGY